MEGVGAEMEMGTATETEIETVMETGTETRTEIETETGTKTETATEMMKPLHSLTTNRSSPPLCSYGRKKKLLQDHLQRKDLITNLHEGIYFSPSRCLTVGIGAG